MSLAPVLTEPSEPAVGTCENIYGDLIIRQGEVISNPQGFSYTVV